jgi:hypothetical protein
VIINGNKSEVADRGVRIYLGEIEPHHTYIFDLQKIKFKDNFDETLLENEWNHVEIMYKDRMEDIRFTDPTLEERSYLLDDDLKNLEITNLQGIILICCVLSHFNYCFTFNSFCSILC